MKTARAGREGLRMCSLWLPQRKHDPKENPRVGFVKSLEEIDRKANFRGDLQLVVRNGDDRAERRHHQFVRAAEVTGKMESAEEKLAVGRHAALRRQDDHAW